MATVVVNGVTRPLGRRVVERLADDPDVEGIVAVERDGAAVTSEDVRLVHASALAAHRWEELNGPIDVIVLAAADGPDRDGFTMGGVDLATPAALLASLKDIAVRRVVVLSSAMVYGAWPDNPVPLTEEAVLRPNPGCRYAADKAELERLATEWAAARPTTHTVELTVLRPAITVDSDPAAVDWMERSLWRTPTARSGDPDPFAQFLHLDDLAAAVLHARRHGPSGATNVAPDGWMTTERQVELVGRANRLRVPAAVAGRIARFRWRSGTTSTPPDIVAYTVHPWVVANDRIRGTGWIPTYTNDEAFIVANREGWWSSLTARRRQDVALGALVAGVVVVAGSIGAAVRAVRQRSVVS